jgi:hypothetical protein
VSAAFAAANALLSVHCSGHIVVFVEFHFFLGMSPAGVTRARPTRILL